MTGWSKAEDALAMAAWLDGKSASEVAGLLRGHGFERRTRNSVIGRLHRLGMACRQRASLPKKTTLHPKIKAPKVPRSHVRPPKPGPQGRVAVVHGMKLGVDFKQDPAEAEASRAKFRADGLDLVQRVTVGAGVESPNARPLLEASGCKWPLGNQGSVRFCCNPITRGAYCEGHAAVAYVGKGRELDEYGVKTLTRLDRVDHAAPAPKAPKRSLWDDAREAA